MSNGVQRMNHGMEYLASWATRWTGSSWAIGLAVLMLLIWLITGPFFHWSDTWQLVMNTIASIITFLMVFLLQRSQNKDTLAIQTKLNELIASQRGADNRLINLEDLSEDEVRKLHQHYQQLERLAEKSGRIRAALRADLDCSSRGDKN